MPLSMEWELSILFEIKRKICHVWASLKLIVAYVHVRFYLEAILVGNYFNTTALTIIGQEQQPLQWRKGGFEHGLHSNYAICILLASISVTIPVEN